MSSLEDFARSELAELDRQGLMRQLHDTGRGDHAQVTRNGRSLVSFSCNDYFGLSHHPAVIEAAAQATRDFGAGAGASRLVTGNHPLYGRLESALAAFKGSEDAVVFGSGYLTNIGLTQALCGRGDLILADRLAHACMLDGAQLSGAKLMRFRHNDVEHCGALLAAQRGSARHCLIMTETVFSMDGDRAPVAGLAELARAHDAWLLTDDAHGLGLIDPAGPDLVPLQMGTLSKGAGGYGGYVCCSAAVADFLRNRARSLVFSTGLPPGVVAAAIAALDLLAGDPALRGAPLARARRFTAQLGLPDPQSAIVPVIIGDSLAAMSASAALAERGFQVAAIRPPTVPAGTARLRVAFSAAQRDADIDALANAIRELGLA